MTNKQVSEMFGDIYNGFWLRYRDYVPADPQSPLWSQIVDEAGRLMRLHNCEMGHQMILGFLAELEDRSREKEGKINESKIRSC